MYRVSRELFAPPAGACSEMSEKTLGTPCVLVFFVKGPVEACQIRPFRAVIKALMHPCSHPNHKWSNVQWGERAIANAVCVRVCVCVRVRARARARACVRECHTEESSRGKFLPEPEHKKEDTRVPPLFTYVCDTNKFLEVGGLAANRHLRPPRGVTRH